MSRQTEDDLVAQTEWTILGSQMWELASARPFRPYYFAPPAEEDRWVRYANFIRLLPAHWAAAALSPDYEHEPDATVIGAPTACAVVMARVDGEWRAISGLKVRRACALDGVLPTVRQWPGEALYFIIREWRLDLARPRDRARMAGQALLAWRSSIARRAGTTAAGETEVARMICREFNIRARALFKAVERLEA